MGHQIPTVIEELYYTFVGEPKPFLCPERLRKEPLLGHSMWAFYQGLQAGVQIAVACLERE